MKMKSYQSPRMKVLKVRMQQMLCASVLDGTTQNENYDEESDETTDNWFN